MRKIIKETYTFNDLLLVPNKSEVLPHEVSTLTKLSKNITLNIPIISAGMDTVTEAKMAQAMALNGGLGIIHKNMSVSEQAKEVKKVKTKKVNYEKYPNAALDKNKSLLCGAAVGVTIDTMERVHALVKAKADVIALDTAHGHSKGVMEYVEMIKTTFPNITLIVGNVVTGEAVKDLAKLGADIIKIGVGPGSICTTRIIAGVGVPQMSAIMECAEAAKKANVTIIADGGIKHSGDIVKALAGGANAVMLGSALAGTEQSPGKTITINGILVKEYRGMGSLGAMTDGSKDRYFQSKLKKFVAEGIEATIQYKGDLEEVLFQLVGGLKSGMGYNGAKDLEHLYKGANFIRQTSAGYAEMHPSMKYIKDAPNYKR